MATGSTFQPPKNARPLAQAWGFLGCKNASVSSGGGCRLTQLLDKEPQSTSIFHFHERCTMNPTRVLLVDDHLLVRAGLRTLLEQMPGTEVVGESSNGREALDLIKATPPDVV